MSGHEKQMLTFYLDMVFLAYLPQVLTHIVHLKRMWAVCETELKYSMFDKENLIQ